MAELMNVSCYTSLIQLLLLKTTGTQVRAYAQKLLNLVHIDTQERVVVEQDCESPVLSNATQYLHADTLLSLCVLS